MAVCPSSESRVNWLTSRDVNWKRGDDVVKKEKQKGSRERKLHFSKYLWKITLLGRWDPRAELGDSSVKCATIDQTVWNRVWGSKHVILKQMTGWLSSVVGSLALLSESELPEEEGQLLTPGQGSTLPGNVNNCQLEVSNNLLEPTLSVKGPHDLQHVKKEHDLIPTVPSTCPSPTWHPF